MSRQTQPAGKTEHRPEGSAVPTPASPGQEPVFPDVREQGLTDRQAKELAASGKSNSVSASTSRSYWQIVRSNVFTLFNMMIIVAMCLVLVTGQWKDAVFGLVVIVNAAIGIFTEVRAKRTLDGLSILVASHPWVRRGGLNRQVAAPDIVLGDVLWVRSGDQIQADGTVLHTWGLELDESMLTGESRTVSKKAGDPVLSGAVATSGLALVRVTAVGQDSYASRLTTKAKVFKRVHSDLEDGINAILKWLVAIVVPMCALLFWSQMRIAHSSGGDWRGAVVSAVAGVVGMIPEGLVLLTSLNFALSTLRLARQKVLIQQMQSVETLARVDCLNLDKTGTLTDGGIMFDRLVPLDPSLTRAQTEDRLRLTLAERSPNPTARAVLSALGNPREMPGTRSAVGGNGDSGDPAIARIPFSSQRKWSAMLSADHQAWYCGAPEILLAHVPKGDQRAEGVRDRVSKEAGRGHRVLLLARLSRPVRSTEDFHSSEGRLPDSLVPVALVLCSESVRPDAKETLAYFRDQGVRCRVISGDNPQTVAAIAQKVDLVGGGRRPRWKDARTLPNDPIGVAHALQDTDVLGRVLPEQKKLIVEALHYQGKTVAMTGDGVNDALAIKEADFGIAMGNASPATKAVADAVIIDSRFSHLPAVVAQGRRVMANMERVASLFLVKTIYSIVLALGVVLFSMPFPYLPRHMTYISALTIGIPAFVLSLPPNNTIYRPGFLQRVLAFSLPSGVAIGSCTLLTSWLLPRLAGWAVKYDAQDLRSLRTCCAILVFCLGILVLAKVSRPLNSWRGLLTLTLAAIGTIGAFIPPVAEFFQIYLPDDVLWRWLLVGLLGSVLVFWFLDWLVQLVYRTLNRRFLRNPIRSR